MFSEAFHNIVNSALPMLIIFIVVICTVRISYIRSTNQKIILHNEIFNLGFNSEFSCLLFNYDLVDKLIEKKFLIKGLKTDIDQKDILKEIAKVQEKGVPKYDNESIYKSFFNSGR